VSLKPQNPLAKLVQSFVFAHLAARDEGLWDLTPAKPSPCGRVLACRRTALLAGSSLALNSKEQLR